MRSPAFLRGLSGERSLALKNFFMRFMYGRYGVDDLSKFLLGCWMGLAVINIFVGSLILYLLSLVFAVIVFYRMFSRNTQKRASENAKYKSMVGRIGKWFRFQGQKLREIGTHRYIRCPSCKATLRVPRKTGKHTLVCPRCSHRFETRILF